MNTSKAIPTRPIGGGIGCGVTFWFVVRGTHVIFWGLGQRGRTEDPSPVFGGSLVHFGLCQGYVKAGPAFDFVGLPRVYDNNHNPSFCQAHQEHQSSQ